VDSEGEVGNFNDIVVDSDNIPHISYYRFVPPPPPPPPPTPPPPPPYDPLIYAQRINNSWDIQIVDDTSQIVGLYTSIALDSNDLPHISYYDETDGYLKYAQMTASGWTITNVLNDGGINSTDLCLDSNDNPHIAYIEGVHPNNHVRYAHFNGNSWEFKLVETGWFCSIALDSSDVPYISYRWENSVKLAILYENNTEIQFVEPQAYVTYSPSICIDSNDLPHILYYDYNREHMKYTRFDGSSWNLEVVESDVYFGINSLTLDIYDVPHVSYYDSESGVYKLKYATKFGSTWKIELIDELTRRIDATNSIAVDSLNSIHISYFDTGTEDLKYAWKINNINSYSWDFGDGSSIEEDMNPMHSYPIPGIYNVTLTVTNNQGFNNSDTCQIFVLEKPNSPPIADAGSPKTVSVGEIIHFSSSGSYDEDGVITSYLWDFNDGSKQNPGLYPIHAFNFQGTYNVTLTVTDNEGITGNDTCVVTVLDIPNSPPIAMAGDDKTVYAGDIILFDGTNSSDPDGDVLSYFWDFGFNHTYDRSSILYIFHNAGLYNISLTVNDNHGNSDTDIRK
jgi:PKD repeat protein